MAQVLKVSGEYVEVRLNATNMFKAYIHVMIVQLLVLAYIAGKPKPINMVKELKSDGMKFEQDDGIRLMDIR
jgi:hypothetical protein